MTPAPQRVRRAAATPEISVVAPLFNEQANVGELYRRLTLALTSLRCTYEIVLVDDGSRDATPEVLDDLQVEDGRVVVLHLSRNFGHQAALSAGIDHARGRAVILMDGDLQDPPEVLDQFVGAWREGHDVVYAVRTRRKEGWCKRLGYALFYRVFRTISDLDIPLDSGDFCLLDRRVVEVLRQLPERERFVRGLRSFAGFRQVGVRYERAARSAGTPKYTLRALVRLAVSGLVGFSGFPLTLVTYLGMATAVLTLAFSAWLGVECWRNEAMPASWAGVLLVVLCLSTFQFLGLGIISEYVRRIFFEVKGRPTYIVREVRRDSAVRRKDRPVRENTTAEAEHLLPLPKQARKRPPNPAA